MSGTTRRRKLSTGWTLGLGSSLVINTAAFAGAGTATQPPSDAQNMSRNLASAQRRRVGSLRADAIVYTVPPDALAPCGGYAPRTALCEEPKRHALPRFAPPPRAPSLVAE